jgi:hypothetical protein
MKKLTVAGLVLGGVVGATASAQQAPTQQSLSASLNVYVFPAAGQAPDQQSKDEAECYQWAVGSTGVDPFALAKQTEAQEQQAQQVQQSTQGAGAKGALGGAAAGALIGEIADDDASKGAAYGAAAGAIMGRRRAKSAQQQAQQQSQQQIQQAEANEAQQRGNFNNAFSVCLEAKQYMVKF